jgi:hypothetical protein
MTFSNTKVGSLVAEVELNWRTFFPAETSLTSKAISNSRRRHRNLRSYARRSMFEKIFCEVKWRDVLYIDRWKITLSRVVISQFFTRCSFPKNICRNCANILVLVLRFLWSAPVDKLTKRWKILSRIHHRSHSRVARWHIFKPNLGKFWRDLQWKMLINVNISTSIYKHEIMASWSILQQYGILCGHLVDFMLVWYIFPVLVCCTKKNLATLAHSSLSLPANQIFSTWTASCQRVIFIDIKDIMATRWWIVISSPAVLCGGW